MPAAMAPRTGAKRNVDATVVPHARRRKAAIVGDSGIDHEDTLPVTQRSLHALFQTVPQSPSILVHGLAPSPHDEAGPQAESRSTPANANTPVVEEPSSSSDSVGAAPPPQAHAHIAHEPHQVSDDAHMEQRPSHMRDDVDAMPLTSNLVASDGIPPVVEDAGDDHSDKCSCIDNDNTLDLETELGDMLASDAVDVPLDNTAAVVSDPEPDSTVIAPFMEDPLSTLRLGVDLNADDFLDGFTSAIGADIDFQDLCRHPM